MKILTVTPAQIQNFIYLLEGAPLLLDEFYYENCDKVFEKKTNWAIPMDSKCEKWLRKELKSYIKHLQGEIIEVENGAEADNYWHDEIKENKNRIALAKRVIEKLN